MFVDTNGRFVPLRVACVRNVVPYKQYEVVDGKNDMMFQRVGFFGPKSSSGMSEMYRPIRIMYVYQRVACSDSGGAVASSNGICDG